MFTQLKDRVLWWDGSVTVSPGEVPGLLLQGVPVEKIIVTEMTPDLELFNRLSDNPLRTEGPHGAQLDLTWQLPSEYLTLDLDKYVQERVKNFPPSYIERAALELKLIALRGQTELFRTLIYVVDRLSAHQIVWGVGRGSSCASLILYLIGLHCVDPVKYDIDPSEFFHD